MKANDDMFILKHNHPVDFKQQRKKRLQIDNSSHHFQAKILSWPKNPKCNHHHRFNIAKLSSNSKLAKISSFVCFLLSISVCAFMAYNSIRDYLEFDVITQIKVSEEMPTLFPTVTICNVNPFLSENASSLLKGIMNKKLGSNFNMGSADFIKEIEIANAIALSEAFNPKYGDDRRKALGFDLKKSLFQCLYNKKECKAELNFTWSYTFFYGNCYQFNSGFDSNKTGMNIKIATVPGENNGLFLTFFLANSTNRYSSSFNDGLRVFIHNGSFPPSSSEGINVKPGTLANIGVKRTLIDKKPYPFSECSDALSTQSEFYEYFSESNRSYHRETCFDLCLQKMIVKKCHCYYLNYPKWYDVAPCLRPFQLVCASEQYFKFIGSDIKNECSINCPSSCSSVLYDLSVSYSGFPTESFYKLFRNVKEYTDGFFRNEKLSYDKLRQRAVGLNIYYPDFKYTSIRELQKTTVVDLVSNIGGTFSLFLGKDFFLI
jgi:hypothetical protein